LNEFEERKRIALQPIFFEAGAGLFDCQTFENVIAYLLYLLSQTGNVAIKPETARAILDDEEKKTAGQLVAMLKAHVHLEDDIEALLADALSARNRLVHRYLVENIERVANVGEHKTIVKEIRALRTRVQRAGRRLDPTIKTLARALHGIAIDDIQSEFRTNFLRDTRPSTLLNPEKPGH